MASAYANEAATFARTMKPELAITCATIVAGNARVAKVIRALKEMRDELAALEVASSCKAIVERSTQGEKTERN